MIDKIFLSSIAFKSKSDIESIIQFSKKNKIKIEFSSGLSYQKNASEKLIKSGLDCLIHNYFPAPKIPFVLNLASLDDKIRLRSVNHCLNGLLISSKLNSPFYSAHSGFCLNFKPSELGRKLSFNDKNISLSKSKYFFLESLETIVRFAEKVQVRFLIENNVIIKENLIGKINPLLGCSSKELVEYMDVLKSKYLGVLLDTAHLKVSSKTLSLNIDKEINILEPYIFAIHHSDNNGYFDSNNMIRNDYWFLDHRNKFKDIYHVLEVKEINEYQIKSQLKLIENEFS